MNVSASIVILCIKSYKIMSMILPGSNKSSDNFYEIVRQRQSLPYAPLSHRLAYDILSLVVAEHLTRNAYDSSC